MTSMTSPPAGAVGESPPPPLHATTKRAASIKSGRANLTGRASLPKAAIRPRRPAARQPGGSRRELAVADHDPTVLDHGADGRDPDPEQVQEPRRAEDHQVRALAHFE